MSAAYCSSLCCISPVLLVGVSVETHPLTPCWQARLTNVNWTGVKDVGIAIRNVKLWTMSVGSFPQAKGFNYKGSIRDSFLHVQLMIGQHDIML